MCTIETWAKPGNSASIHYIVYFLPLHCKQLIAKHYGRTLGDQFELSAYT